MFNQCVTGELTVNHDGELGLTRHKCSVYQHPKAKADEIEDEIGLIIQSTVKINFLVPFDCSDSFPETFEIVV